MALYQSVCGVAVLILLSANGCYSRHKECGRMMEDRYPHTWSWEAGIKTPDGQECLGSLISDQWVLTSMNCGFGPDVNAEVHLGSSTNYSEPMPPVPVDEVICSNGGHGGGRGGGHGGGHGGWHGGMCLLKLSTPVNFTDSVSPICLPSEDSTLNSKLKTFIFSSSLPKMKAPLIGEEKCRCYLPELPMNAICSGRGMRENFECPTAGRRPMGAAMAALQDDTWSLIGLSDGEQTCEESKKPLTFLSVAAYQEWIANATGWEIDFYEVEPDSSEESDEDKPSQCPDPPRECWSESPEDCDDDSVFSGGANMSPSSPFVVLSVLLLSLFLMK